MEPLEMMLVDTVLHHLQIVAVDQPRAQRSHSVLSNEHIIARQERRWLGTEIGKNDPGQLLNLVGALPNAREVPRCKHRSSSIPSLPRSSRKRTRFSPRSRLRLGLPFSSEEKPTGCQ